MRINSLSAVFVLTLTISLLWCAPLDARKKPTDHLSPKYKRWLDEVHYIITKNEREVFLKLQTDRERDILIEAFWKHRDPTNGTADNEFKDEHYRRLQHVEKTYGRSKTRAGWETDRGKVYIILGPPLAIQRFTSYTKIYPTEVWHYQQAPRAGLPPAFNIIFFDRNNTGEYVLYSPVADGPQKLLIGYQGKPGEYLEAYQQLAEFNSFLARTSMSLVPGEETAAGQPAMASDFLLRNIEVAPKKAVSDLYARKYLKYKGMVEVEYSANYAESKSLSRLIKDASGNNFYHYIIRLNRLAVDQYEDRFFTTIVLYGSLTDKAGKSIYQFEKNFNVRLNPQQFQMLQKSSFAISDYFPVIPGNYRLSIVLKNTNSKEFTAHETDISVPGTVGKPFLTEPVLAYDTGRRRLPVTASTPFGTTEGQLSIDPEPIFNRTETMHIFFQISGVSKEFRRSGSLRLYFKGERGFTKTVVKELSLYREEQADVLVKVPMHEFSPDYYEVEIALLDGSKKIVDRRSQRFMISPLNTLPRPQVFSKSSSLNREAVTAFTLGTQYLNAKQPVRALPLMQKAYNLNPNIKQFAMGLARIYLQLKRYEKVEPLLKPLMNPEKPDFQVYFLLGNVCQKTGKYGEAVNYYRKLIAYHGSSTGVLNPLASCYYNMGQPGEARKAWEHSLKIDPGQEKVKKALEGLKNETQKN
jgi:GWxTD domain-containing protein